MALSFDHITDLIEVSAPQTSVLCQDLINGIREYEASAEGIVHDQIARASGKENLGDDVAVGITVELLGNWQLRFWSGNYIARVSGGNLVGGPGNDPIAYSAGVQVLLVQSAASTVVLTGSGLSQSQADLLDNIRAEAKKSRQMQTNRAVISADGTFVNIYDDDLTTILHTFNVTPDKLNRTPV